MSDIMLEPADMEWVGKGVLGVTWTDGHKSIYPVRFLRQHCPCAACTDEWTGELRLKPDDVPMLILLQDVEAVGRYALRRAEEIAAWQVAEACETRNCGAISSPFILREE